VLDLFDYGIVQFVNSMAHRSGTMDLVVVSILSTNLLKGVIPITMLYWAWFQKNQDQARSRTIFTGTLVAAIVALSIGRLLQLFLPFRPRPLYNPALSLQAPEFLANNILEDWSSMPSDTAMLFAALTLGIWMISRPLGVLSLLHLIVFVVFAKLYAGLHYPSDLLVGAVLGFGTSWQVLQSSVPERLYNFLKQWQAKVPGLFYSGFFLVTFELANMFEDVRSLADVMNFALHGFLRVMH
jgi:undecaprenyl-diphosphatase